MLDIKYTKLGVSLASRITKLFQAQDLGKLENIRKMSNLDGDIVVSLSFRSYNLSHSHNILLMTMYNNSSQKVRKSKYQIFLIGAILLDFFTLFQIFCAWL